MKQRVAVLMVLSLGAAILWRLQPRDVEGTYTPEDASRKVGFPFGVPKFLPEGVVLEGVMVTTPVLRIAKAAPSQRPGKSMTGFGIAFRSEKGPQPNTLAVLFVFSGSPAEKAGILTGDEIVSVNGESVASLGYDAALRRLRESDTRTLEIQGPTGHRRVKLERTTFVTSGAVQPPIPKPGPIAVYMYDYKGRKFTLSVKKRAGVTKVRWAGQVLRQVDLDDVTAVLRNISGHLALTWEKDGVEYDFNNYQDGLTANDMIAVARSIDYEKLKKAAERR